MRTYLTAIISILLVISCSSGKNLEDNGNDCKSIRKNNHGFIKESRKKLTLDDLTLSLNEVRYHCVYTAMYTQKAMYDRYGKWDELIYLNKQPVFLWKDVSLFANDSTKFNVAANGLESTRTTYASIMVFDSQNNDLLSKHSSYKVKLIELFSSFIKSNDSRKEDFYEKYWKTVNPKHWEYLQQFKINQ